MHGRRLPREARTADREKALLTGDNDDDDDDDDVDDDDNGVVHVVAGDSTRRSGSMSVVTRVPVDVA